MPDPNRLEWARQLASEQAALGSELRAELERGRPRARHPSGAPDEGGLREIGISQLRALEDGVR